MIEFVVRGTPRSPKARSKHRWQHEVQCAVPPEFETLHGPLRLRIDFFFDGMTNLDTDNIIKPIQDALEDVLYEDDESVVDVCARKINLQRLPGMVATPEVLVGALAEPPSDFVFVRLGAAHAQVTFS